MRDLQPGLRTYLWTINLACLALIGTQTTWLLAKPSPSGMVVAAAVFAVLSYAGERTRLQVSGSVSQTLATAVHVALILIFPPPFPLLATFTGTLIYQISHARSPFYKRCFNICHPTLAVGITSWVFVLVTTPTPTLRAGHVMSAVPALLVLVGLYYVMDVGMMLVLLAIAQRQAPWRIWWQLYRRTLLPEFATSSVGTLAAVAWQFDHVLLALFVLPVIALGMAFRVIGAEERALSLRRRGAQLEAILAAGQHLRLQHSQEDLMQPVAEAARVILGAASATAYLRDPEDPTALQRIVVVPGNAEDVGPSQLSILASNRAREESRVAGFTADGRVLLVPLEPDGMGTAGLIRLTGLPAELADDDRDTLAILATQAAIALQNAHLHERALAQASQDGLTGLLNHRAFQIRLEEEVDRARRSRHPLALLMVDLDDFGSINNRYGHQVGDAALSSVASALGVGLRASDVAARYGGDEFAVILPETDLDEALVTARRMRDLITAQTIVDDLVTLRVDASVGVAALLSHAYTRDELIRAADQAAYAAKNAGKGRVGRPEDAMIPLNRDPAELSAQLENANLATVEALAAAVDAKDPYTRGHSQRVSAYAFILAEALGLSAIAVARVRLAGLLHDVGKIGVPDSVLTKPGLLTVVESSAIKQHPVIGERVLSGVPFLQEILPAVRHHHERWDGGGYPDGLAGAAIPQDATILMVADSFDAMTTSRTYRPALPLGEAHRRLKEGSGAQFDPRVVAAFDAAFRAGRFASGFATDAADRDYTYIELAG